MKQKKEENTITTLETNSSPEGLKERDALRELYETSPIPTEELMCNFGLYTRSGALVKYLVINEIYEMILETPGSIMEFGVWRGQNIVLFENFRAILEPFNKNRRIIGFDTFEGYRSLSEKDSKSSAIFYEGNFSINKDYCDHLQTVVRTHEKINVLGHIHGLHQLVAGDCCDTVPAYFKDNPDEIVALAYLDMGLYKPTKIVLENILKHTVQGSIIVLDELNWSEAKGERLAFKEVFKDVNYDLFCSKYTKERVYIRIR